MKTAIIVILVLAVIGIGVYAYMTPTRVTDVDIDLNGTVCTMDAKLCPDGSYVGRTGPNCEFAACPTGGTATSTGTTTSTSTSIRGTVITP